MKINFEKLSKLEHKYSASPVTLEALQDLVSNVITNIPNDFGLEYEIGNKALAFNTLVSMGVIELEEKDKPASPQLLKS